LEDADFAVRNRIAALRRLREQWVRDRDNRREAAPEYSRHVSEAIDDLDRLIRRLEDEDRDRFEG
jgi:hypothetical protein